MRRNGRKAAIGLLVCILGMVAAACICPAASAESALPLSPAQTEKPFTWAYLATIAGASTATLLAVQFLKLPLDRVGHIPTRLLVYVIAWAMLTLGTYFTEGLTLETALLAAANALLAAMAAMGAYEVTFAKLEK